MDPKEQERLKKRLLRLEKLCKDASCYKIVARYVKQANKIKELLQQYENNNVL